MLIIMLMIDFTKAVVISKEDEQIKLAILKIKHKYGKNAILKGMNLQERATTRERNRQIGGHHE